MSGRATPFTSNRAARHRTTAAATAEAFLAMFEKRMRSDSAAATQAPKQATIERPSAAKGRL